MAFSRLYSRLDLIFNSALLIINCKHFIIFFAKVSRLQRENWETRLSLSGDFLPLLLPFYTDCCTSCRQSKVPKIQGLLALTSWHKASASFHPQLARDPNFFRVTAPPPQQLYALHLHNLALQRIVLGLIIYPFFAQTLLFLCVSASACNLSRF